ncbi:replication protein A 14 kDa subunit [Oxyura jamaicensis]|uniref:replication protein A 14 kDa subunit n=1 Tax=Oxyura jamaicensis TaxID=8884 RepID=UPI0015A6B26B|nr:replication protein A 14 kDa subunit [Oxyura jamaicensis]
MMEDAHEAPRHRIAAAQLAQHIGRPVCFVGRLHKVHPSGKLFVLTDGEGKQATVEMSEPLDEEISGVIEVVGRVTNQATIMCMSYVQFREDKSPFDLELYNEALKIIHEFPEYFPFGTGKNN